jgi:YVTN family beta-propeller protein
VALKLLAPELAEDERFRERFLRESRLAASLDHPNVIPIYEAGESEGVLFIAMRYVEGTDLKRLLEKDGKLEPARALALLAQAANALDEAHEHGLVHRDVKPGNILIALQGGREHVYLSDFGLTKQTGSESGITETGQFMGTADYVSPEQIEHGSVDARSDLYSLGCVLYECLVGQAPYRSESLMHVLWAHVHTPPPRPSEHRPELPVGIDAVIAKAIAKAPDERYESGRELVAAAQTELPASGEPERGRARRRPHWSVLAALGAAFAAAAVAAILLLSGGEGRETAKPTTAVAVDSLQRIDPKTNELVATIPVASDPSDVAVGEGAVWISDHTERTVAEIDPQSNTRTRTIAAGGDAVSVAAGLGSVWVANALEGTLVQIDPGTGAITKTIDLFGDYGGGPVAVGEGAVWVGTADARDSLWRIDPHSKALAPVPTRVEHIVPDYFNIAIGDGAIWVPHLDGTLSRVDPETNTVVATIRLRFRPVDAAAGEGGVWITDNAGDALVRIDPVTNRVAKRIPVGDGPFGVATGNGSVWVANRIDGTVSRIDPKTNEVVATIEVGPNPKYIAAGEDEVWVTVSPQ